jgi:hypothetical protein
MKETWMLKSFYTGLELWISILTMNMSMKTRRLSMLSQDLKGMQHCGGMNYKLIDAVNERRKSRVGIE